MKPLALLLILAAAPAFAETVELATPVPGVVEQVAVKPGQRVKRGAVLLKLEPTRLQAAFDEADALAARAELDLADAAKDLARAEDLYARTVSSTTELDAAKLRRDRAAADARAAGARRTLARKNLDDAVLRAPFDGVVKKIAAPGTALREGVAGSLATLER